MIFEGPGLPMKKASFTIPSLRPGEILVRNRYTTICGSDIHTYCGKREEALPTILGHEIVGEIVAFASDNAMAENQTVIDREAVAGQEAVTDQKGLKLQQGDLITWSIFSSDPASFNAQHGMPQKGNDLFKYGHARATTSDAFHGGLGQYCILRKGTAVLRLPQEIPLPIAATINCAISTVAGAIRLAENPAGKNVVVFGTGLLGLTCVAMCKEAAAASITVVEINRDRREMALAFGADQFVLMDEQVNDQMENIQAVFERPGFDLVFDMSGSPEAMELGLKMMATGAIAIWIGAVFKTREIRVDPEKLIRGLLTIKGLHNYNYEDFINALDFITLNWEKYPFGKVVERVFTLDEVNEAFEYAIDQKPLRVGVRIPT